MSSIRGQTSGFLVLASLAAAVFAGSEAGREAHRRAGASSPAADQEAPAPGRGPALYATYCQPCHGERGRGDGPAGRFLEPAPRDLTLGPFRLVTTTNAVPSDKDLFEVVSAGLPGTAMLGVPQLPAEDRWELVKVIRSFRRQGLLDLYRPLAEDKAELAAWVEAESSPGPPVAAGEASPDTVDSRARGRVHFRSLCAACHGVLGRGDALPDRLDSEGRPVRPRDLGHGVLKGGIEPADLVARIRCGMPGTPMPAVPASSLDDRGLWDLVHYLRTIIPAGAQELHDPIGWTLRVPRVAHPIPASPDDARWDAAPELHVALAPFRSFEATIPGLLVRALHDGEHVIFRIVYPDATRDVPAPGHRTPPDAIAARVTSVARPPVLPLPGQPLPLDRALWLAGTMPPEDDALFDRVDPRFTNPDSVCKSPIGPEKVGSATWRDGLWTLVMALRPDRAGQIRPGRPMSASFAAFDGSLARGPLPVAFTAWQDLRFE